MEIYPAIFRKQDGFSAKRASGHRQGSESPQIPRRPSAEHKKQPRFCVVLTRFGAVPVLIPKPFPRSFLAGGQASGPRQSGESRASIRFPPPFSPFSSIVTPYTRAWHQETPAQECLRRLCRGQAGQPFTVYFHPVVLLALCKILNQINYQFILLYNNKINKFKKNISIISYKSAINIRKIANKYINFIFYNIFQSIILFVLHLYFKHYIFHFHKS